jgi:hypothetical protein
MHSPPVPTNGFHPYLARSKVGGGWGGGAGHYYPAQSLEFLTFVVRNLASPGSRLKSFLKHKPGFGHPTIFWPAQGLNFNTQNK